MKAVAESLAGLINTTRINSNHQFNPQVIDQLRQLSTGTVFSITKLVKTVQIVRDDQLKGPTALKSTISILQNKSEVSHSSEHSGDQNVRTIGYFGGLIIGKITDDLGTFPR